MNNIFKIENILTAGFGPTWNRREFVKFLSELGFYPARQKGSHETWNGPRGLSATIPNPLNPNMAEEIVKQRLGINYKKFIELYYNKHRTQQDIDEVLFASTNQPRYKVMHQSIFQHKRKSQTLFDLKKIVLADIRGEFWITDSGQSMFADSDISDYNHEAYVFETILNSHDIGTNMGWLEINNEAKEQKEMLPDDFIKDKYGFTNEEINVLRGSEDARNFAMKEWGWKRLQDNNVETWTLASRDLKAIANGLWDAYQDEVETSEFNIFVGAAGKWYSDIPYELISAENPMSIASYQPNQYTGYAGPKNYQAKSIFDLEKFAAKTKKEKKKIPR